MFFISVVHYLAFVCLCEDSVCVRRSLELNSFLVENENLWNCLPCMPEFLCPDGAALLRVGAVPGALRTTGSVWWISYFNHENQVTPNRRSGEVPGLL